MITHNKHGAIRSEIDTRDWQLKDHPLCKAATLMALPKRVSLKNGFGRIYNQQYGNCTSCAVLGCDAYYYHDPKKNWLPSATFTYYNQRVDLAHKDPRDDCGSSVIEAIKAVRQFGVCNSKVWQNRKPFYKKPSHDAYVDGLNGKEITDYYSVNSIDEIKKALFLKYPVVVASYWVDDDDCNSKGIIRKPSPKEIAQAKLECGHAYIIVGYDDELGCFQIRNSWGKSFGIGGYAYMRYSIFSQLVWWNDCYAIVH